MAFYTRGARRSVRARTSRRTPLAAARAQASRVARSARIAAYREAPMLANLAVRGLNLAPGEFKAVDVHAATAVTTTPIVVLLNGIARGDDINERTGREVDMRSIQFSAQVRAATTTGVDQTHRVLIVYDRQTNAAAPTMAQVCESATIQAPRNLENRKRFSILFDKIYNLNAADESGSSRQIRWYRLEDITKLPPNPDFSYLVPPPIAAPVPAAAAAAAPVYYLTDSDDEVPRSPPHKIIRHNATLGDPTQPQTQS